jgi:hypothetical protein
MGTSCSLIPNAKFSQMELRKKTVKDEKTGKECHITEKFAYWDVKLKFQQKKSQNPTTGRARFVTVKTTHRVDFKVTNELAHEAMVIMHALTHCIEDALNKRFQCAVVVNDLLAVWNASVKHDEKKSHPAEDVLDRLAKFFNVTPDSFYNAWKELHMIKEVTYTWSNYF